MSKIGLSLFLTTLFLSLIGIFILYESSTYSALLNIGDRYYFVKYQIVWVLIGVVSALILSRFSYKRLYSLSFPALIISFILLLVVFLPGIGLRLKGASRWIHLGFITVQPSELLKISLTTYLAAWLSLKEKGRLLAFLILLGLSVALVVIEPDMGTAGIIAVTATIVYFLSGVSIKEMVFIGLIVVVGVVGLVKLEPYRVSRLAEFQNFDRKDLSSTSYHVKQILVSLGSGGVTGVGLGKSIQKYAYLPENTTDSIFAIFAEETGFVGSLLLISIFVLQLVLGFLIAAKTQDPFGRLLAVGIITFIGIQTLVNLASQAVLVPLTGVPLPFISYGGSSMVINFMSIGILLNIAREKKVVKLKR